jgi:hypothetical protein
MTKGWIGCPGGTRLSDTGAPVSETDYAAFEWHYCLDKPGESYKFFRGGCWFKEYVN